MSHRKPICVPYRKLLTTTFCCALILCSGYAWGDEVLTAHSIAKIKEVEEIAISPDGRSVAYALEVPRRSFAEDDGPAWVELHVVDEKGSSRAFASGEIKISKLAWRPGSSEVSFLAKRGDDEKEALYSIPLDGGEARRLVGLSTKISDYSWHPDGSRVALIAELPVPAEQEELQDKGFTQKIFEEDWLPMAVWIAELDTAEAEDPKALAIEGSVRGAVWSPDGNRLALKVAPSPSVDDSLIHLRIRIYDLAAGKMTARIENPGKLGELAWSPDSRFVAVISAADPHDPREGRLMVAAADGGELRDLLPGLEGHVAALAWQDERSLLFMSQEGVETRIGRVDRHGGKDRTVLPLGGPDWADISLAASGDLALIGSTSRHPNEIFVLAKGSDGARRLTDSNPWLASARLAPQELVRYRARDGLELEGLLIRPLEEQSGQRYPLVVVVHGGPESHYRNGWLTAYSRPGQELAAKGFAVFYPNYRASTGRGVAFSKLDHGDPGGKEFDDLVDGVDHLIASGLVDGDRVGITGGSYGGYAAAWGATYYSERFAAAVMSVGISDMISKFGTSDIPQELYRVHERQWPWEDWQHALERSPVYHVEKARTPILILHGEDDTRVYPGQSLILHRYLKLLGKVPVRLVLYPGEGHGNRRAASRLDFNLRLVRWMEHYLRGPGGDPPPWQLDYQDPQAPLDAKP